MYRLDDPEVGLAHTELSLRLKYLMTKSFHPHIGIVQERVHGNTASMVRDDGESTSASMWVLGFNFLL